MDGRSPGAGPPREALEAAGFPIVERSGGVDWWRFEAMDGNEAISHLGLRIRNVRSGPARFGVGSVGAVETREAYRRRGIATALVRGAMEKMRAERAPVMLVSGGRGLYLRLGCTRAVSTTCYRIDAERALRLSREAAVREAGADIGRLTRIHALEAVGFERSCDEFEEMLGGTRDANPHDRGKGARGYLAGSREDAYFVVSPLGWFEGGEGRDLVGITEYAGPRETIAGALGEALADWTYEEAMFCVSWWDGAMHDALTRRGVPALAKDERFDGNMPGGHTLLVIDAGRLWEGIMPYVRSVLPSALAEGITARQDADRAEFRLGEEGLSLERSIATAVIFGTASGAQRRFLKGGGTLGRALGEVFPMPFPQPGLDHY